jgi:hypothetical protein
LKQIAAYPEIVNRAQEQQVEKEDGTTETVRVNPILEMLMNTNLQGDAFHQNLMGVVASLNDGQVPAAPPQAPSEAGMTPPPAGPSNEDSEWEAQYQEAFDSADHDRMFDLLMEKAKKRDQKGT